MAFSLAGHVLGGIGYHAEDFTLAPWYVAALLAVAGGITVLVWRRLDEAAREAHKWAWYWGGSFGMAAGFALVVLLGRTAPTLGGLLPADAPAMAMMAMGAMILMLSQLLGLFVAWAFWWWRAR